MKKLASLLATVAVFAMSACAWAALDTNDVASLADSGTASAVGKISGTAPQDGFPKVDGDYTANVYYYGTISDTAEAELYVNLAAGGSGSTSRFYVTTADKPGTGDQSGTASSGVINHFHFGALKSTTPVTYTFGKANDDTPPTDWASGVAKAKLALTPTEVKFETSAPITIKTGEKPADTPIELVGNVVRLSSSEAFSTAPTVEIAPAGSGLTAAADKYGNITFTGSAVKGTYVVSVKSAASSSLCVDEIGGKDMIFVQNFPRETVFATFHINVADYDVAPASYTYIIPTSKDSAVSFDIDMAVANFAGVSDDTQPLVVKADLKGTPLTGTSNDVTVSETTKGIEVVLTARFLNDIADKFAAAAGGDEIDETVTLKVVDSKTPANSADIAVKFRTPADPYRPAVSISSADVAIESADGVTGAVVAVNVEPDPAVLDAIADTTSTNDAIDRLIASHSVVSLDIVSTMTVSVDHTDDAATAKFSIDSFSREPKSGFGYFAMIAKKSAPSSYDLFPASIANDKLSFMIWPVGDYFSVKDIYIVEAQTRSSSSSSSCDTGFGLAALSGLAALALRRRGK